MKTIQGLLVTFILIFLAGCAQKQDNVQTSTKTQESEVAVQTTRKQKEISNNILAFKESYETIAMVFPSSDIDRYALEATNTLNAYLLQDNKSFALETFDMMTQNKSNILKVFDRIREKKIKKVILLLTKDYVNMLASIPDLLSVLHYLFRNNKPLAKIHNLHDKLHFLENKISTKWRFIIQLLVFLIIFLLLL